MCSMSPLDVYDRSTPAKSLLFFSGIAALIDQTIWMKQLTWRSALTSMR